jgi:hypothetical protein
MNEGHHILQLISKSESAPRLVGCAARPQAAGQGLVQKPAVGQHVEGRIGRFHMDRTQRVLPLKDVIHRYLDCGDLHCGFARIKCENCGHEYILGFSCKRRHLCPSCHQKRAVEYGEWLLTNVLKAVPHRQWVFSIPKRLRIYFMYDRKLLAKLSKCGWNVINTFLKSASSYDDAVPGASISVHTYGEFLNFNPHLHAIASDGCFRSDGSFQMAPDFHQERGLRKKADADNQLQLLLFSCT